MTLTLTNNYMHGAITPTLALQYDFGGSLFFYPVVEYTPDGKWYFSWTGMAVFGDPDEITAFSAADMIHTSEMSFKVGYRW